MTAALCRPNIVGYDNQSGFGLLQAIAPLNVRPLVFGKSAAVKEARRGGGGGLRRPRLRGAGGGGVQARIRRQLEYLLDEAIFTAPPHPAWSGAALLDHEGKLVGVGFAHCRRRERKGRAQSGNMFVPTEPVAGDPCDLMVKGRIAGAGRPWLGINTDEMHGHLVLSKRDPRGPRRAGRPSSAAIRFLGVNGEPVNHLTIFYRKLYAQRRRRHRHPARRAQGQRRSSAWRSSRSTGSIT